MDKQTIIERERGFHDSWAASIDADKAMVMESFEAPTAIENRIILQRLGDVRGRALLDLGCGAGEAAVYFAVQGASASAIDVSEKMLAVTEKVARKFGVNISTKKCSCEQIEFPDGVFDIVYASNVLHHSNLGNTLSEVRRVLKPGGIFVSWDPLAHSPLISLYRKIASGVRTADERPLRIGDIDVFRRYFSSIDVKTTWLTAQLIFVKFYLLDRVDPNKERYWKKILTDADKIEKMYRPLEKMDGHILNMFPFLRRYCWNMVICGVK